MADFVQTTVNKTAVRDLAVPIVSVTSFNNLIQSVIDDNPFGCVGYTGADGEAVAPVVRNREHYTAKVNFINGEGKRIGTVSLQSPTITAFEANAAAVMEDATIAAAMGGEAVRNSPGETYYAQLKCHDPSGDDFYVTFTRKTVRLSSYQDDTIRNAVETWADTVGTLE
ncbi:hypothetical protein FGW20_12185 [Methanoculleus sp. FWC-SCC3]|uniref:Uncharacterized protein n=1 Tax=Methanoculleus methanifontis TaxID=2584086 RepID=A0ABT8M596_9EURY|nr:hypothetical protein [Methanoculleus sp. FWC-SCC3]MDN7013775.1 hypothetical protein [Methanoculleus sp. FWC-SCC3]